MKNASRNMIRDFSYEKSLEGYRAAIDYVLSEQERRGGEVKHSDKRVLSGM
jgi:hypothetical protein